MPNSAAEKAVREAVMFVQNGFTDDQMLHALIVIANEYLQKELDELRRVST